jgi:hypothetical protein
LEKIEVMELEAKLIVYQTVSNMYYLLNNYYKFNIG